MEENKYSSEGRFQKRVRLFKIVIPLAMITALAAVMIVIILQKDGFALPFSTELLVAIASLAVGLGSVMLNYLEGKSVSKSEIDNTSDNPPTLALNYIIKEFQQKLENIEKQVDSISKSTSNISLLPEDKNKLFHYVEQSFSNNINENIFKYLEEKYAERSKEVDKFQEYLVDFTNIKARMANEITKLNLRANTNLTIGSVTTIIAVLVLYITVTSDKVDFTNTLNLLGHFVPRLTVVVFIEIFAFFFLKLYKNNIDIIRYYHNELTNIDLKLVSLKQAIKSNDTEAVRGILIELSRTERNFIIKKEETTIELERMRQDGDANKNMIGILGEIFKLKK